MLISFTPDSAAAIATDWLIVLIADTQQRSENIRQLDTALGGSIAATTVRTDFEPKAKQLLTLYQTPGVSATNAVLTGVGLPGECDVRTLRLSLLAALRTCCQTGEQTVAIVFDDAIQEHFDAVSLAELTGDCVTSAPLDGDVYKADRSRHSFASVVLCVDAEESELTKAANRGVVIGEACNLVKNLVNRHPDDIYPETFAAEAASLAGELGLDVVTLDESQLRAERMGAMLAVAKGSSRAPRLVKISYRGAGNDDSVLALVGKGVTFDSGGYSIKQSDGMLSMKADMAGAATALGVVIAAARLKLNVNVTAYMGLVENMISGSAYRLGDVLTARNGTTIEVHNTDAEGRLVLADVLAYAVDEGVNRIIDMATLTGACVVALGEEITGVFPNNESFADEVCAGANAVGEFFWQMPMHAHFDPLLKSSVADCKNVGPRWGGASTAARFLQKFVGDTPWVHLDIAGPSWTDTAAAWQDAGGTAVPVRSLIQLLRSDP